MLIKEKYCMPAVTGADKEAFKTLPVGGTHDVLSPSGVIRYRLHKLEKGVSLDVQLQGVGGGYASLYTAQTSQRADLLAGLPVRAVCTPA